MERKLLMTHLPSQGIQALYGRKTGGGSAGGGGGSFVPAKTTRAPTNPRADNELCSEPKVDALFNSADGSTYAFKGKKYYKLTENAVADGYPKFISDGWPGLTGTIFNGLYIFETIKHFRTFLQEILMLLLHIKMVKHISSKASNTGDIRDVKWMVIIPNSLAMDSQEFRII